MMSDESLGETTKTTVKRLMTASVATGRKPVNHGLAANLPTGYAELEIRGSKIRRSHGLLAAPDSQPGAQQGRQCQLGAAS